MRGILADINLRGHFRALVHLLEGDDWREIWTSLDLKVHTFASLGLALDASDLAIWQVCQQQDVVFVTGNRNQAGPNSLEEVIRTRNTAESLPVITVADLDRLRLER